MLLNKFTTSFAVLALAIFAGVVVYHEHNFVVENEFSPSLTKWRSKGSYFTYNDVHRIFYVYEELDAATDVDSPVLLFLHGFPTSSFDYANLWRLFLDKSEVPKPPRALLTFDYLGYGFSDKPVDYDYSIFDMADMVDKLLLHLNVRSVLVVAHDVGDTVAQEMIRRDNLNNQNHYHIAKCVLMNGGIVYDLIKPRLGQDILRSSYLKKIIGSKYVFRYFVFRHLFRTVFGEFKQPSPSEMYDFYLSVRFNEGNRVLPLTIAYMREREEYGDVWYNALNETKVPTMFVYGPADPISPREKFPQRIRSDLPAVKLVVLSDLVGHYPQLEDTFTVFQIIRKFIGF